MRALPRLAGTGLVSVLLAVGGCDVGSTGSGGGDGSGGGGGDGSGGGGGGGGGQGDGLSGSIVESATLSGDIHLAGDATIEAGVILTIASGSSLSGAEGAHIIVEGTLLVDGTADATVSMIQDEGAGQWGGIQVASGGSATVRYATGTEVAVLMDCKAGASVCALERIDFENLGVVVRAASIATLKESRVVGMNNGAVSVVTGGDLTVSDTELMTSSHDLVTASGGSLTVEYSNIGGTVDTYEHCNMHIGSAASLTVTRSNIVTGEYGIMIGSVPNAELTYNNWVGNSIDISVVGSPTNTNFQHNYWANGTPSAALSAEFDFTNPEGVEIIDAGPRI